MNENFLLKIKKIICRFFGHKKGETWEYIGINSTCKRCGIIYKSDGFNKQRNFKEAYSVCNKNGYIYRVGDIKNKYSKNHNIPMKKRVSFLNKISKDWTIVD